MARKGTPTRKFGGKTFKAAHRSRERRALTGRAQRARNRGHGARIVKSGKEFILFIEV